jgi:hypothetical protein
MTAYYKVTDENGWSCHGGSYRGKGWDYWTAYRGEWHEV